MSVTLYALSGVARSGACRSDYTSELMFISVDGVQYGTARSDPDASIIQDSISISMQTGNTAPTINMTAREFTPSPGKVVEATLGSSGNRDLLFGGVIQSVSIRQMDTLDNMVYDVTAVSHLWTLGDKQVFASFSNVDAHDAIDSLLTSYAPAGFTLAAALTLGSVSISFNGVSLTDAIDQVTKAVGADWRVDNKVVRVSVGADSSISDPALITNTTRTARDLNITEDLSQIVTRAIGVGGTSPLAAVIDIGETIVPIGDTTLFDPDGGSAVLQTSSQKVTYTGVQPGGGGAVVGLLATSTPGSAPTLELSTSSGMNSGTYKYAVTVTTADGESLPGPTSASVTTGTVTIDNPSAAPIIGGLSGGSVPAGIYYCGYTFVTAAGETRLSPLYGRTMNIAGQLLWTQIPAGPKGTIARRLYRNPSGGGAYSRVTTLNNNTDTTYTDNLPDASLGTNAPGVNTATVDYGQVKLTNIPISVSPEVTGRKLYRTAAGGSQLKLLHSFANNTDTDYTDSSPDSSLGADVPTEDTSGIVVVPGQVQAGSDQIVVTSVADFSATGGWAAIGGSAFVRYTGISGAYLTGVPTSGNGSLVNSVNYGSVITPVPALTGVPASGAGSVTTATVADEQVAFVAVEDDTGAQTTLANLTGGDGIREATYNLGTIGYVEARSRTIAQLQLLKDPVYSMTVQSRDTRMRAGATASVHILQYGQVPAAPARTFLLQRVTVTVDSPSIDGMRPLFTVDQASTMKLTLEDILRTVVASGK